jgi:hypothetical protein
MKERSSLLDVLVAAKDWSEFDVEARRNNEVDDGSAGAGSCCADVVALVIALFECRLFSEPLVSAVWE